jgi:Leucine-rich repeat (LRR) protein
VRQAVESLKIGLVFGEGLWTETTKLSFTEKYPRLKNLSMYIVILTDEAAIPEFDGMIDCLRNFPALKTLELQFCPNSSLTLNKLLPLTNCKSRDICLKIRVWLLLDLIMNLLLISVCF